MTAGVSSDSERRHMDEAETELAEKVYAAMMHHSNYSSRSMQAKRFKVGISDLGYCSERMRRMLDQQVPEDTDVLAAFIGTAIGEHVEQAIPHSYPDAIVQASVSLDLKGDQYTYTLEGHPDVILPSDGIVVDGKTDYGLQTVRRMGPSQQQQFQRHGYALAAWQEGYFGDLPLEEVRVANFWVDRAAIDKGLHVHMERFDPEVIRAATDWLDEVVYNFRNDQEAPKEPPRNVCEVTCGFYKKCRAFDTDAEGLIRDPVAVEAARMYAEGTELAKHGKNLKDQGRAHLIDVRGSTGEFTVRWIYVNGSPGRDSYERLDVKPIPGRTGSDSERSNS